MHAAQYIHSYTCVCVCVTFYQDLSTLKNLTARRTEYAEDKVYCSLNILWVKLQNTVDKVQKLCTD